jgi:hypothetical protein
MGHFGSFVVRLVEVCPLQDENRIDINSKDKIGVLSLYLVIQFCCYIFNKLSILL